VIILPKGIYIRKEESKKKISTILKQKYKDGKIKTPSRKGILHTEETKKKQSKSNKGRNTWTKGTHMSEELKRKLSLGMKGEKGSNWRGGVSSINHQIRNSLDYHIWRSKVFQRDSWTCQTCNVRGVYLNCHHIKGFAEYPELRFDVNNGVTLCKECHRLVHIKKKRDDL
jgi:hypothetical protein